MLILIHLRVAFQFMQYLFEFHVNNTVKKVHIVKDFKPLNVGVKRWITIAPYSRTIGRKTVFNAYIIKKLDERKYWDNSGVEVVKERMELEKEKILKEEQVE